jgi:hypothetical protein
MREKERSGNSNTVHRHTQKRKNKVTWKLTNSTTRKENCELNCFSSLALGLLSIVSFGTGGDLLGNLGIKIGLSHNSIKLIVFPFPSMFVLCFGRCRLRCILIGFSSPTIVGSFEL